MTARTILFLLLAGFFPATITVAAPRVQSYIREVPAESTADARARHEKVAARRAGPIIIVHRGASAFAPENTLEAYAAAMDYGADGCEIDIRRTADGVLVLFHDEMLDRLTDGFGLINKVTYHQLLNLRPRVIHGTANNKTRTPTLAALLVLARQRAMLLHLDIKEPDLEEEIIRFLDAADAWDHVVSVNDYNSAKIRQHPRLKVLRYKTAGLFEDGRDMDPPAVKAALSAPGEMLIVDDPRVAARELKREPYRPVPLPKYIRVTETVSDSRSLRRKNFFNQAGDLASRREQLVAILKAPFPESNDTGGASDYQRRRTERILDRAWASHLLGQQTFGNGEVERLLEQQVLARSLHSEWFCHGIDGAMAARALAARGATGSAPVLIEAFRRQDPELKKVANPRRTPNPLSWVDSYFKMYLLMALGGLRCEASKNFLNDYVMMDVEHAREFAVPMFREATQALVQQNLSREELIALLRSTNSAVRGTAVLACLDHPNKNRSAALKSAAPWALDLPRAK